MKNALEDRRRLAGRDRRHALSLMAAMSVGMIATIAMIVAGRDPRVSGRAASDRAWARRAATGSGGRLFVGLSFGRWDVTGFAP